MRGSTPGNPHRATIRKGHKPHLSITKGLKSLAIDNQSQTVPQPFTYDSMSPIHSSPVVSPSTSSVSPFIDELRGPKLSYTPTQSMDSIDESWDVVEDLPYRWATDYVSLAITGSRLANTSVLFYDIWSDPVVSGHKGALLAVATKSTILLYETPKGERAFRFVKVSYDRSYLIIVTGPNLWFSPWGFAHPGILYPWSTSCHAVRVSIHRRPNLEKRFGRWRYYTPDENITLETRQSSLPERIIRYSEHSVFKPTQPVPHIREKGRDHSDIRRIRW